jgi:PhnO protein
MIDPPIVTSKPPGLSPVAAAVRQKMHVSIREAIAQDADSIHDLICDLENTRFPAAVFTALYAENLENPAIGYFVALAGGEVAGFGSVYLNRLLHHCGSVAEIQELVVRYDYRNRTVGRQLLLRLQAWSRERGALQVEVTCNNARTGAQRFYQANGFVPTHQKLVLRGE